MSICSIVCKQVCLRSAYMQLDVTSLRRAHIITLETHQHWNSCGKSENSREIKRKQTLHCSL